MEFIATPTFSRHRKKLLSEGEFLQLRRTLASNPAAGNAIVGLSGIRKIRYRRKGHGKSGGVRVIYFWVVGRDTIILLDIYPKSAKVELSGDDRKRLASAKEEILRSL